MFAAVNAQLKNIQAVVEQEIQAGRIELEQDQRRIIIRGTEKTPSVPVPLS